MCGPIRQLSLGINLAKARENVGDLANEICAPGEDFQSPE